MDHLLYKIEEETTPAKPADDFQSLISNLFESQYVVNQYCLGGHTNNQKVNGYYMCITKAQSIHQFLEAEIQGEIGDHKCQQEGC